MGRTSSSHQVTNQRKHGRYLGLFTQKSYTYGFTGELYLIARPHLGVPQYSSNPETSRSCEMVILGKVATELVLSHQRNCDHRWLHFSSSIRQCWLLPGVSAGTETAASDKAEATPGPPSRGPSSLLFGPLALSGVTQPI